MSLKWLRDNWFLLAFVFSSGSAFAWQEVQRQTLTLTVAKQHVIVQEQVRYGKDIAVMKSNQIAITRAQDDIKKKLDLLIEIQLKK